MTPRVFYRGGFWRIVTADGRTMAAAPTVRALSAYVKHPWFREAWA